MKFVDRSCVEFVGDLASKSAVPGGGGASALVGAVGIALGSMVGNLTTGKKRYADVEAEINVLLEKAVGLQATLVRLVDDDAAVFEPLAKAYSIPRDDPGRAKIMEEALRLACTVPMDIMRTCAMAIELHAEFAAKGSVLAISDAGVGAACCKAALQGASLNVFINTGAMLNRKYATVLEAEADALLEKYCDMADSVYESVVTRLRRH